MISATTGTLARSGTFRARTMKATVAAAMTEAITAKAISLPAMISQVLEDQDQQRRTEEGHHSRDHGCQVPDLRLHRRRDDPRRDLGLVGTEGYRLSL